MITRTKNTIKIPHEDWEKMKKHPSFSDTIELIEDIADYESSKKTKGKDLILKQYLKKRGLRNNS
jgi:hypothetical protein